MSEGPPTYSNLEIKPVDSQSIGCMLKFKRGQQVLTQSGGSDLHVLCRCDQPSSRIDSDKVPEIIAWMSKGWMFITTVTSLGRSGAFVQMVPIGGASSKLSITKERELSDA